MLRSLGCNIFCLLIFGAAFQASAQSTAERNAIDRYVDVAKRAFNRGAKDRFVLRRVIKVLNGELEVLSKNTGEINEIYSRKQEVMDLIQERITSAEVLLHELEASDLDMFKEKTANAEIIKQAASECCEMLASPSMATRILANSERKMRGTNAARRNQRQAASDPNFRPQNTGGRRNPQRGGNGANPGARRGGGGQKGGGGRGGGRAGGKRGATNEQRDSETSPSGAMAICVM
jgi:uncharacterized membrane protein YgcG